jgi:hypothetical protein
MARKSFTKAISEKTALKEKSGISAVFSSSEVVVTPNLKISEHHSQVEMEENIQEELRQSFIVLYEDLEKLKDFVYFKKMNQDPFYSQKEALHSAFQLLFATEEAISERPEKVKKQERLRNANIRRKRANR